MAGFLRASDTHDDLMEVGARINHPGQVAAIRLATGSGLTLQRSAETGGTAMLDVYPSHFTSDRAVIRASWQRVVLSRAICTELNRQVAESRKLLQQSQRTLAKSRAERRSGGRPSPAGERREPHCCRVQTTTISTVRGNGTPFDDWCDDEAGSLHTPDAYAILSELAEGGTPGDPSRQISPREYWPAWPAEVAFRVASFVLIGLIYAATALALWAAWQEF